jgi:hypothetical protein
MGLIVLFCYGLCRLLGISIFSSLWSKKLIFYRIVHKTIRLAKQMSYVLLKCVKEGSRLRVKMMSSAPFMKGKNCQFPRNIRQDGMYYVVRSDGVSLKNNFYSAMGKDVVVCRTFSLDEVKRYIGELGEKDKKIRPKAIFGDDDEPECVVCMTDPKTMVFAPCGHFLTCQSCIGDQSGSGTGTAFKKCFYCNTPITCILRRDEIKD